MSFHLSLLVIPEGNPRFARIGKTASGGEPLSGCDSTAEASPPTKSASSRPGHVTPHVISTGARNTARHLDRSEAQWRDPCISPLQLQLQLQLQLLLLLLLQLLLQLQLQLLLLLGTPRLQRWPSQRDQ
ncbi:MAG: hypothetical protein J0G35_05055 [Acidobacteriales bacterium]|nr:hypothetical protein [Terriglobales bacterium]